MYFLCSATVTNLQQKLEQAMTTNALMKEDLAISKNTILELEEEKKQAETQRDTILHTHKHTIEVCSHCGHPIQNNNNINDTWVFSLSGCDAIYSSNLRLFSSILTVVGIR